MHPSNFTLLITITSLICACQAELITPPPSTMRADMKGSSRDMIADVEMSPAPNGQDMEPLRDLDQTLDIAPDFSLPDLSADLPPDLPAPPKIVLKTLKAFPTAEGYGAAATGGRGGRVLYVTTTEDTDAQGSLRWALKQDYPRIIYFLVGGTFKLESLLYVTRGDVTIAGETAHDLGGVHITGCDSTRDCRLYFSNTTNMIIRYISVEAGWRKWEDDGTRHSAMTLEATHRVIIDHYTGGWGSYTGGAVSKVNDTTGRGGLATTQRSLLHEGVAGHNVGGVGGIQMDWVRNNYPPQEHAKIWEAWDGFTNHHNAFIGLTHRFFNTSGHGQIADQVYNNYIYGWSTRMSRHTNGSQPIDIYRNYYEAAPYNSAMSYALMHKFDYNSFYNLEPAVPTAPNFFIADNLILNKDGTTFQRPSDDNWSMLTHFTDTSAGQAGTTVTQSARRTQLSAASPYPVSLSPVEQVKADVLDNCGSGVRFRPDGTTYNVDPIDQRYINWAKTKTGPSSISRRRGDGGLGDSATFVLPDYPSMTRSQNTLNADGTPRDWRPPDDVINEAGYSNLELYLAELAGDLHILRRAQAP